MTTKLLAACVLVASLAGCSRSGSGMTGDTSTETPGSVRGPLLVSGGSEVGKAMAAGLVGRVTLSGGCLRLGGSPVVWPYGTEWNAETKTLTLTSGGTASLGDWVEGGGGTLGANDGLADFVGADVAAAALACRRGPHEGVTVFNRASKVVASSSSPSLKTGPFPADSRRPASGTCEPSTGAIATVRLDPDIPEPRCIIVSSGQRLRVVNTSASYGQQGKSVTIRFAYFQPRVLKVRAATTFHRPVGQYLAPGVHDLHVSLYGRGGPEIWLK
jgi:hypothetical protein